MWISEQLLYVLAKRLYRSEIAHSNEMKESLIERRRYDEYRSSQADLVLSRIQAFGHSIEGKRVLDLGCNNGSITRAYLEHGAKKVVGVDIDEAAILEAQSRFSDMASLSFLCGTTTALPLADASVDMIVSFDVFEHVEFPDVILAECHRVLTPGGVLVLGTWGWGHPFAPHLWSTMPVPWSHLLVSERTLLRACRRVYESPWYVPNMHDLDANGAKIPDKYRSESIATGYLNKLYVRDFERLFKDSPFMRYRLDLKPFGSRYAKWTKVLVRVPWIREFFTSALWACLEKAAFAGRKGEEPRREPRNFSSRGKRTAA